MNGLDRIEDESAVDSAAALEAINDPAQICQRCRKAGRIVPRKTMFLMLKSECFDRVTNSQYRFCVEPGCVVTYFAQDADSVFTTNDLRIRVGLKGNHEPLPLCYCFGFDEGDLCKEIEECGHTTIPDRIAELIRQGFCACLERNPSGGCCLGEINKAVKRLTACQR